MRTRCRQGATLLYDTVHGGLVAAPGLHEAGLGLAGHIVHSGVPVDGEVLGSGRF